jgi:prepilin-type N-terminal cleavage/methylation domain-containing protein
MKAVRGFTLIELLVVIAVIAVLLAILIPSLNAARMHAKRIGSTSNMRQIGLAMELYTEDHRGFFPETSHGLTGKAARRRSWIYTLSDYVGDVNEVRICPADPKRRERIEYGTASYTMNEYIAVNAVDPFGRPIGKSYRNKYRLKRAGQTITTFVGADDLSYALTSDHTHSRLWFQFPGYGFNPPRLIRGIQFDQIFSRIAFTSVAIRIIHSVHLFIFMPTVTWKTLRPKP